MELTETQMTSFEIWIENHIEDHGHQWGAGFYIRPKLFTHAIYFGSEEYRSWISEKKEQFLKEQNEN